MLALTVALASLFSSAETKTPNPLEKALSKRLTAAPGVSLKLPAPTMADGLSAAAQKEVLKKVVGDASMDRFLSRSRVAPQVISVRREKHNGKGVAQLVDLYFVAYGDAKKVTEGDFLRDAFQKEDNDASLSSNRVLTEADLRKRGLALEKMSGLEEDYTYARFSLFKRVEVSGVFRSLSLATSESILAWSATDPRFAKDATLSNQWRPIRRNGGELKLGTPVAYAGMAGYTKVTPLKEPGGALFIEFHSIMAEPHDWFDGANLLGSKLPIVLQAKVREFRGALKR